MKGVTTIKIKNNKHPRVIVAPYKKGERNRRAKLHVATYKTIFLEPTLASRSYLFKQIKLPQSQLIYEEIFLCVQFHATLSKLPLKDDRAERVLYVAATRPIYLSYRQIFLLRLIVIYHRLITIDDAYIGFESRSMVTRYISRTVRKRNSGETRLDRRPHVFSRSL